MVKKKGVLFFAEILLYTIMLVNANEPSPVVVQGIVSDLVFESPVDNPELEVIVSVLGNDYTANTKWNSPKGNHEAGHYDVVVISNPGTEIKVTARIKGTSCIGTKTGVAPGGDEKGMLYINPEICCNPVKASNFNPIDFKIIKEPKYVSFSWVSGRKGNINYPDLWEDFQGPKQIFDVSSPLNLNVESLDGWNIRTCNGIKESNKFCCVKAGVGWKPINNPCPKPTNLKGIFSEGYIITSWESFDKDEDGDNCHDVWKAMSFSEGDNFDNPSWRKDSEPANKKGEIAIAYLTTYWKVKSCDEEGLCSEWAEMIIPSCNQITSNCPNLYDLKKLMARGKEYREGFLNEIKGGLGTLFIGIRKVPFNWWIIILIIILIIIFWIISDDKEKEDEKNRKKRFKRVLSKNNRLFNKIKRWRYLKNSLHKRAVLP